MSWAQTNGVNFVLKFQSEVAGDMELVQSTVVKKSILDKQNLFINEIFLYSRIIYLYIVG